MSSRDFKLAIELWMRILMGAPSLTKICWIIWNAANDASTQVYGTKYRSGLSAFCQHALRRSPSAVPGEMRM